jgi:hypothetical protein
MSPIERVVLLGFSLDGPVHAAAPKLGEVHFGPASFLRDLELRLGLPTVDERPALRLARWTSRLREVMQPEDFYAKSFLADELGTAELLLKWRDDLVEAPLRQDSCRLGRNVDGGIEATRWNSSMRTAKAFGGGWSPG